MLGSLLPLLYISSFSPIVLGSGLIRKSQYSHDFSHMLCFQPLFVPWQDTVFSLLYHSPHVVLSLLPASVEMEPRYGVLTHDWADAQGY